MGQAPAESPMQDAVAIAAGEYHTCAINSVGAVQCWGSNSFYQSPKTYRPPLRVGYKGAPWGHTRTGDYRFEPLCPSGWDYKISYQPHTSTATASLGWRCVQGAESYAPCGDGVVDAGESCDDGNRVSGDGCDANCTFTACGNGVIAGDEVCDDGNTADGDYCSEDCSTEVEVCGDGYLAGSEACDDGNTEESDYCASDCNTVTGRCGDGVEQSNEACDDGNTEHGDYCAPDCSTVTGRCGDGVEQSNEACDDGNTADGDYCSADCSTEAEVCGDGYVAGSEACDDGASNTDAYGQEQRCNTTCDGYSPYCGDGAVSEGEACDDGAGNTDAYGQGQRCNTTCDGYAPYCGDGTVSEGEACDDGAGNIDAYGQGQRCNTTCDGYAPYCGDDIVSDGEACDDGNRVSGDGCSELCQLETERLCGSDFYLGSVLGQPAASGSTTDAGNDFIGYGDEAPDIAYLWQAPISGSFTFDTMGSDFDTKLEILDAACGQLATNDDGGEGTTSLITLDLDAGTQIVIVVDGYSTDAGNFVLNITQN